MEPIDNMDTAAETVVGPSVKIHGDLNSEGNIRIEGAVAGKVKTSQSVHVGESAKLTADINAGNAIIAGEVQGNLKISGNLVLTATARIAGDINCAILRVEDGAQFTGKCSMSGSPGATTTGPVEIKETKSRHKTPAPAIVVTEPEPEQ